MNNENIGTNNVNDIESPVNYNENEEDEFDDENNESSSLRFSALYQKPKPRQQWIGSVFVKTEVLEGSSKAEEAWVELFIDLVYVVLIYKLGDLLTSCFNSSSTSWVLIKVFIIFWSLCLTRMAIDEYANRFYSNDLAHKIFYLIYTAGVAVQVMNVNSSSKYHSHDCGYYSEYSIGIMVGILITRLALILIHLAVMSSNEKASDQFIFDIYRWGFSCCVAISSIVIQLNYYQSQSIDTALQAVIIASETIAWLLSRSLFRYKYTYPIDLELLQIRWGVWIMIVIGEAIIQLLLPSLSIHRLTYNYSFDLFALVLMFSLAMQYYDACQRAWFCHAITKSALAGIIWIWLHLSMSFCMFGVGIGLKMALHDAEYCEQVISICCGLVTLQLSIMRLAHSNFTPVSKYHMVSFILRLILSMTQISVPYWSEDISVFHILVIETIIAVVGFNLLDVIYEVVFSSLDELIVTEKKELQSRPFHRLSLTNTNINENDNNDENKSFSINMNMYPSVKKMVRNLSTSITYHSNDSISRTFGKSLRKTFSKFSPTNMNARAYVKSKNVLVNKSLENNKILDENTIKELPKLITSASPKSQPIYNIVVPTPRQYTNLPGFHRQSSQNKDAKSPSGMAYSRQSSQNKELKLLRQSSRNSESRSLKHNNEITRQSSQNNDVMQPNYNMNMRSKSKVHPLNIDQDSYENMDTIAMDSDGIVSKYAGSSSTTMISSEPTTSHAISFVIVSKKEE